MKGRWAPYISVSTHQFPLDAEFVCRACGVCVDFIFVKVNRSISNVGTIQYVHCYLFLKEAKRQLLQSMPTFILQLLWHGRSYLHLCPPQIDGGV